MGIGTNVGVRGVVAALGAAVVLAAPAARAAAQQSVYVAQLTPGQQVNPVVSSGSGFATLTLTGGTMLNVNLVFSNLTSNTLFAHIHAPAPAGQNSPAIALPFPNFTVGVRSGTYNSTIDLTSVGSYTSQFLAAYGGGNNDANAARLALVGFMNSGLAYVNVHSANYQAGEIRGQVSAVPEPSTYALLAAGLGGAGLIARRRRA